MAYSYDPYDPEEVRRRNMMAPETQATPMDEVPRPDESEDSPPEENDEPAAPTPVSGPTAQPTESQRKYQQALGQIPRPENYKPSGWRRFGAALAGGALGIRDPVAGYNLGHQIASEPYQAAMSNWQRSLIPAQGAVQLDKDMAAQDVARRRAGAYEGIAGSRQRIAASTESLHNAQINNMPWHPKTKEDAMEFEASKHNPPAERRPTSFEEYMRDPQGYSKYLEDVNKGKTQPLSFDQRMKLQNARDAAAMSRVKARGVTGKPAPIASPADQARAEEQAAKELLRTNPEYANYVDQGGMQSTGLFGMGAAKKIPLRIKSAADLPKTGDNTKDSLLRDRYNQFLSDLDKRKKAILGTRKDESGSNWTIEEEEDQ